MRQGPPLLLLEGTFSDGDDPWDLVLAVRRTGARTVTFNSNGGNLGAALAYGRMIRDLGLNTVQPEFAECSSACAFAFMGGVLRSADSGAIGVHQTYFDSDFAISSDRAVDAIQQVSAAILKYLDEMGVDARLLQLSMSTSSDEMRYLTDFEMDSLRVTTRRGQTPPPPRQARVAPPPSPPPPAAPSRSYTPPRNYSTSYQPSGSRHRSSGSSYGLRGSVSVDVAGLMFFGPTAGLELGWGSFSLAATARAYDLGMISYLRNDWDQSLLSGHGLGLKARYFWGPGLSGTYLGLQVEQISYSIETDDLDYKYTVSSSYLVPQVEVGYRYAPDQTSGSFYMSWSGVFGRAYPLEAELSDGTVGDGVVVEAGNWNYLAATWDFGLFF